MVPFFLLGGTSHPCCSVAACCAYALLSLAKDPLQAGVLLQFLDQVLVGNHELQHDQRNRFLEVGVRVPVAGSGRGKKVNGVNSFVFPVVCLHEGVG